MPDLSNYVVLGVAFIILSSIHHDLGELLVGIAKLVS